MWLRALVCLLITCGAASAQIAYVPSNPTSGTVGTGNTFQQVLNLNYGRHGCYIQNTSTHTLYVFMGLAASATTAKSFQIAANGFYDCSHNGAVLIDPVAVTTSTTSDTFIYDEY